MGGFQSLGCSLERSKSVCETRHPWCGAGVPVEQKTRVSASLCLKEVQGCNCKRNAGSNSTREAVHATMQGFSVGMDAALHINPYYGKTSETGVLRHFKTVLEEGPAMIYNVPGIVQSAEAQCTASRPVLLMVHILGNV